MNETEVCACSRAPGRRRPGTTTDGLAALKAIMQHQSGTLDGITAWRAIMGRRCQYSLR